MNGFALSFILTALVGLTSLSRSSDAIPIELRDALTAITPNDLMRHVTVLASDEFEGRATASSGEELTVKYLIDQFRKAGLDPGNPDGSYIQNVPLMGVAS